MSAPTPSYRRREPEKTVLYEVIRRHYNAFIAQVTEDGRSLPGFVEREFEKFTRCGILAHGFVRVRCGACGFDRLVAHSCKGRGFCASCIGRRMADTAAYLTDHVLADVPMRSWTLTLPQPLRYLAAYKSEVLSEVITAYSRALFAWQRRKAKEVLGLRSINKAHPGMATWVQRFGSAANLNVHLHSIAFDGVFVEEQGGQVRWQTLPEPTSADVSQIAWDICQDVTRKLRRRGLSLAGAEGDLDELAEREPLLAACYNASLQGFVATGRRAGQRVMHMGVPIGDHEAMANGPAHGFNLFAGRVIAASDKKKRERVIRYMARPPIPTNALSWTDDGHVLLKLKRAWSNSTTHMKFTGPELVERLVSLVPPPRVNLVRYHGVLAPNARLRPAILPKRAEVADEPKRKKSGRYLEWAEVMARVFEYDVTHCPKCDAKGMQVISCITQAEVIREILECIGQPTAPPTLELPPRTAALDFDAA